MRTSKKINGIDVFRVNNDVYGNPRYAIHWLDIANDYETAHERAKSLGGRKYTAKWFGGGMVFQSYNIEEDTNKIVELRKEAGEL